MEVYEIIEYFLKAIILAAVAYAGIMTGVRARRRKNEREGQE